MLLNVFWEVGSKRPVGINIQKAWNLTFAYSFNRGSCRINNECPRRYVHRYGHNELNTPRGIYRFLVSGERNFAGFLLTKTSANKRFL